MPTIGERLLAQTAAREEAKRVLEEKRAATERRKEDRDRERLRMTLRCALEDLRDAVEDNVEFNGRKIKGHYSMPYRYAQGRMDVYFWQAGHPYNDEYKAMAATARLDGVEYVFDHAHDGMGMESWITINFKPLAVYTRGVDEPLGHGHGL